MLRELLAAPGAVCPACGETRTAWAARSLLGLLRLLVARVCSRGRRLVPLRLRCAKCLCSFEHVHALSRTVIGYHGCRKDFARALVAGTLEVANWRPSRNNYDWLGEGIYFWEHAP